MNFGPFIIAFEISCNHSYHHAYNYLRTILNTILHLGFLYKNRMVRFVKPKYPIFPENSNLQYVVSNLFSISHILFPLPHKPYIPFILSGAICWIMRKKEESRQDMKSANIINEDVSKRP
jgi:hypothetical protein